MQFTIQIESNDFVMYDRICDYYNYDSNFAAKLKKNFEITNTKSINGYIYFVFYDEKNNILGDINGYWFDGKMLFESWFDDGEWKYQRWDLVYLTYLKAKYDVIKENKDFLVHHIEVKYKGI